MDDNQRPVPIIERGSTYKRSPHLFFERRPDPAGVLQEVVNFIDRVYGPEQPDWFNPKPDVEDNPWWEFYDEFGNLKPDESDDGESDEEESGEEESGEEESSKGKGDLFTAANESEGQGSVAEKSEGLATIAEETEEIKDEKSGGVDSRTGGYPLGRGRGSTVKAESPAVGPSTSAAAEKPGVVSSPVSPTPIPAGGRRRSTAIMMAPIDLTAILGRSTAIIPPPVLPESTAVLSPPVLPETLTEENSNPWEEYKKNAENLAGDLEGQKKAYEKCRSEDKLVSSLLLEYYFRRHRDRLTDEQHQEWRRIVRKIWVSSSFQSSNCADILTNMIYRTWE
eukprot:GHVU01003887.1.p1 GENE.GHVU01003887.1~~GHVU01003887.1.p1  ORF type:complete len:337 (+),score=45.14 GHVU01003887.1:1410-2420(+)